MRSVLGVGLAAGAFIEIDELVAERVVALLRGDVRGLNGSTEGGSFAGAEGDDFGVETIGGNLAPGGTLAAAASETDLGRAHAEFTEATQTIRKAERGTFDGGTREVRRRHVRGAQAVQNASAVGQVGRALAVEIGQEHHAIGSDGCVLHGGFELIVIPAEHLADLLGDDGDVHGADERQPLVRAVAEGGDFALAVDHRFVGDAVERAAGAEARCDAAGLHIAGADRAHHVVAAARADDHVVAEAPLGCQLATNRSVRDIGRTQRRQHVMHARVDEVDDLLAPLARAHVEDAHAGGVAVFHALHAAEPEVDVVVRQQDGLRLGKIVRLVLLEPQDLGDGVAGQDGVACEVDAARLATELVRDLLALRLRAGVAPELGRAHGFVVRIEHHDAVLLTANADAFDELRLVAQLLHALGHALIHGVNPGLRMLLQMAGWQTFDEVILRLRVGDDFA